jgi:uncharacterized protein (DUF3084 family)
MTVVMGGIIAYTGDLIGRRYGKRRASLFGLRPKHTAILITSAFGGFISIVSLGVVFLLVPTVRSVILEGEQAIRLNRGLRSANASLEADIRSSNRRLAEIGGRIAQLQADLKRAEADLGESRAQLVSTTGQLKAQKAAAFEARRKETQALQTLRTVKTETKRLAARNVELRRQSANQEQFNNALGDQNYRLSSQRADLERRVKEIAAQIADLETTKKTLEARNTQLVADYNALKARGIEYELRVAREYVDAVNKIEQLEKQCTTMADEIKRFMEANRVLTEQVTLATAQSGDLRREFDGLLRGRVAVHRDEDLARIVIPANSPGFKVREALEQLLHNANLSALDRGAGPGESSRAVKVVDRKYLVRDEGGEPTGVGIVGEAERVEAMIRKIEFSPNPVCVLAIAVANSLERQPAQIDFQPYNNKMVYNKGQVLGVVRMDTNRNASVVFNDLVDFLKKLGRDALEDGVIPQIDATGIPQVGSLNAADLATLMDRVRNTGARVKITARASRDIYASDRLEMDFAVEVTLR